MIAVSARPLLAASTAPAGADRDGWPAVIHAHLISLRAAADVLSAPATSTQEDA